MLKLPCRHHRRGDLRNRDRPGRGRQTPLPEKRDVPKPGGEERQTGGQPGFHFQQPGRFPECHGRKPKGVFYLSG